MDKMGEVILLALIAAVMFLAWAVLISARQTREQWEKEQMLRQNHNAKMEARRAEQDALFTIAMQNSMARNDERRAMGSADQRAADSRRLFDHLDRGAGIPLPEIDPAFFKQPTDTAGA